MGYGGAVDILTADVNAIVQGITGSPARTLNDVASRLDSYLYAYGSSAAALLFESVAESANIAEYLSGASYSVLNDGTDLISYINWIYYIAVDVSTLVYDANLYLSDISIFLSELTFDGNGRLRVTTTG